MLLLLNGLQCKHKRQSFGAGVKVAFVGSRWSRLRHLGALSLDSVRALHQHCRQGGEGNSSGHGCSDQQHSMGGEG